MAFVITDACLDVLDPSCTGECPVGCIYEGLGRRPDPDRHRGGTPRPRVPARRAGGASHLGAVGADTAAVAAFPRR
ncbi:hypothetical protein [Amycolatopsis echigonensis]|uniref:Uncharacterized protein n=1 Tax=Amycolatopsis echigonensis TaxID=2576905 RepID=A0A2N3WN55_9PSEU|nr:MULTISPECIES: hypothetical protein [Amycolatopsis]MBB2503844.1 hypothetical protein [Amycolatopsis echigonensis]PKV95298.1 hypothetical protein ATK30_6212 [Amycolatopsis niigatensis]